MYDWGNPAHPGAAGPSVREREAGRYKVALNRCAGSTAG